MCISALGTVTKTWFEGDLPMAEVAVDGRARRASALYVPDVQVGASVIVHLDYIVDVLDPSYAEEVRHTQAEAFASDGKGKG